MKQTGILIASMLLVGFCHAQDRAAAHPPPIAAESTRYGWADVLRVDPVYEQATDNAPLTGDEGKPPCNDEPPPPSPPPPQHDGGQADNRAAGTVIGALVGVVVGHAFGRGDGNKAATVAGGVAGGIAGNRIAAAQDQAANQAQTQADAERDAVTASLRDCRETRPIRGSSQPERRIVGYDVEYRYKGEIYMARLPFDPGDRMRVKITVVPVE